MFYPLYEAGYYASTPLRFAALAARDFWSSPLNPAAGSNGSGWQTATAPAATKWSRRC